MKVPCLQCGKEREIANEVELASSYQRRRPVCKSCGTKNRWQVWRGQTPNWAPVVVALPQNGHGNLGRTVTLEQRQQISRTRLKRKREAGVKFCEELGRPIFKQDGREAVFLNGKKKSLARALWEKHHGATPSGWIVHHINGDKSDDRLENLISMSRGDHWWLHAFWSIVNSIQSAQVDGNTILPMFFKWIKQRRKR